MVQRLLQNRPLPAELDLLSRQLGRVNKSAPEDEFGRWKQQMERLRSGPRVAVAPSPPPAQPPQRFRPYALLAGEPPSAPAAAAAPWATDRAGARLPVFDYHRQPPAGKGPFASVTVPSSTDQLRGEEFPTGRLVRMRDPLEQQLVDMATSAERQSLLRRRPLAAWGRQGGVGALQADPGPPQERFMTLSDIEQQLRYHTQQTNRLRKILNAAGPRRA
ncbi:uncharacterized protein LOC126187682 [Schistocerca cancellata]|uniref:uncharacterized protein LOC126187682 n=1 Tax=Schistocerca cancellata TaxID=274614 RepID=UPI002117C97B|nr:uncharacterized protein LOC126187682 [Schistocerca cancellata]